MLAQIILRQRFAIDYIHSFISLTPGGPKAERATIAYVHSVLYIMSQSPRDHAASAFDYSILSLKFIVVPGAMS